MARKLDFCLRYKISIVYFDGYSWKSERLPRYTEMMRELNRFARQRGMKLVFGGYGMAYGDSRLVTTGPGRPAPVVVACMTNVAQGFSPAPSASLTLN